MNDDQLDAATYTYKMADRYTVGMSDPSKIYSIAPNSFKTNPVELNTVQPNYNITFHNTIDGKQVEVGKMNFNGG